MAERPGHFWAINHQYILTDVRPTGRKLGSGSYGTVVEVQLGKYICVAKKIHENLLNMNKGPERLTDKFVQESELLSNILHPNIARFFGLCLLPGDQLIPALVMERLETNLHDFLATTRDVVLDHKCSILKDVACGLLFLHQMKPPFVHRDLIARNILLTSTLAAKITDLGNCRIIDNVKTSANLVYLAPEALDVTHAYTPALDIFSFGHLALCTIIQDFPTSLLPSTYYERDILHARSEVERRGIYIALLDSYPAAISKLIKRCLKNRPDQRPCTEGLLDKVQSILGMTDTDEQCKTTATTIWYQSTTPPRQVQMQLQNQLLQQGQGPLLVQQGTESSVDYSEHLKQMQEQLALKNEEIQMLRKDLSAKNRQLQELTRNIEHKLRSRDSLEKFGGEDAILKYLTSNPSSVTSLFRGFLKSILYCSCCKKISESIIPFVFLSLPIPESVSCPRIISVQFMHEDPDVPPRMMKLKLSKDGCVLDLKNKIRQLYEEFSDAELMVVDVYNFRFHRIYNDQDNLELIMDSDDIYVYELPVKMEGEDVVHLPVYHREETLQNVNYSDDEDGETQEPVSCHQLFGLPMVVTVPRECSNSHVRRAILDKGRRYIRAIDSDQSIFRMTVVNSYGSQDLLSLERKKSFHKFSNQTYIACDWNSDAKSSCYLEKLAEKVQLDHSYDCQSTSLMDCIDLFLQTIPQERYCPNSNRMAPANNKFDLWQLPDILVFHLKRFSDHSEVNEETVDFPIMGLNLSRKVRGSDNPYQSQLYDLFAVSNYCGEGQGYTYALDTTNHQWYNVDDNPISQVDVNQLVSNTATVLFYHRTEKKLMSQKGSKKNKGVTSSSEEGARPSLGVSKRSKGVKRRVYHHKQAREMTAGAGARGFLRRATSSLFPSQSKPKLNSALVTGSDSNIGDSVALDCEFVGTGLKGKVSMLGRCSIVNHHGNVLYDTYVAPLAPVTDYRTPWSGIRKFNLEGAPSFMVVQSKVMELLKGRMLVGHDLREDLRVLDIAHPLHMIRDTSRYTFNPFQKNTKNERSKLKSLLKGLIGVEIQDGEHCSVEDAQAAMLLYQHSKVSWEQSLTQSRNST